MRYLLRAVKYFLYLLFILFVFILVLVLVRAIEPDPATMFRNGYKSIYQIALMLAGVSAFYPLFGYAKKMVAIPGSAQEVIPVVKSVMEERGYMLEKEEGEELMTFRLRSPLARLSRTFEDRITFNRVLGGFEAEGLRRDVFRLVYAIEYKARSGEDEGASS